MAADPKRAGSITYLLVGLILMLAGAGLFVAFAPVVRCQRCAIAIAIEKGIARLTPGPAPANPHNCSHCDGKGRVTLLTHWLKCPEHFLP